MGRPIDSPVGLLVTICLKALRAALALMAVLLVHRVVLLLKLPS